MSDAREPQAEAENGFGKISTAPAASRIFGKFRLLANLGSGGMGEVFLALSRNTLAGVHKLIVIKRLRHFAEDEVRSEARQMFLNEARLATLLNHPNIVQTNDVGVEDGHMYLTMEYLEGQPLNAIVKAAKTKQTRLDDAILIKIISDALAGLHYAHDLRDYDGTPLSIVHRDLSPHNLFVTYEGVAKVVDFGIAKSAGSSKTEQGVIKGKFAYMAPEQAADEKVDRRADVFVMGIVLWELLTGERLVYRRNDVQTVNRLLNDKFSPPSSVRSDIVPELDAIIMKALAKDPAERYQSAREMREALEEYLIARSHPVRQEAIGPLISELFKEERTVMRERIRQCIATAPDDSAMDNLPALSARPLDSLTSTPSGSRPETSGPFAPSSSRLSNTPGALSGTLAATVEGSQSGTSPFPSAAARKGRVMLVTGIALAAVIAITVYGAIGHRGDASASAGPAVPTEKAATPAPAETPPAAETVAAATAPTPPPAAAPVPVPAAPPSKAQPGRHWSPPPHAAPPAHATPAAAPPPPQAAPPAPPPTPTATTHAREFNTSL